MKWLYRIIPLILGGVFVAACNLFPGTAPTATPPPAKPNVIIVSPPSNTAVLQGDEVRIHSVSVDTTGIILVELSVDGQVIQNSPTPNGQPQSQFSVIQSWNAATPGSHTITVTATNSQLLTDQASITIIVNQQAAGATPTASAMPSPTNTVVIPTTTPLAPTNTPTSAPVQPSPPPSTCTLDSKFVADVTIPDGTTMPAGSAFVKTWAIQNTGTCAWDQQFGALFVGGEPFGANSPQAIPPAAPGQVVNITINMIAPVVPGPHSSVWQVMASNGIPFGQKFDAVINVPGAPPPPTHVPPTSAPVGCIGAPILGGFTAFPSTISPGQIATLSWGPVTNANAVYLTLPGGSQPVGTPGSLPVQPTQTTTFTLTAYCGNTPAVAQVTVYVQGGGCVGTPIFGGFYANPQKITAGQTSTLTWGFVQNASAVFLQMPDKTEGVATPGTRNVKPKQTTTYTLIAQCGNTQVQLQTTVFVESGCSGKPNFNGFTANPNPIQKGQSTTLSWGLVTNATSVVLQTPDGSGGVPTPGQVVVSPHKTTTYTLIAYCYNVSSQLQVTVQVKSPATPTPTPPPVQSNQIQEVVAENQGGGKWKLTVRYYWNGEKSPAYINGVGVDDKDSPVTSEDKENILAGYVKYVILHLKKIDNTPAISRFVVCMVGKNDHELACKTVPK